MAIVIHFDKTDFDNFVKEFIPDAVKVEAQKRIDGIATFYDGDTNSIVRLNKNIAVSTGKAIMFTRPTMNEHKVFVNSVEYDKVIIKIPPRQGGES